MLILQKQKKQTNNPPTKTQTNKTPKKPPKQTETHKTEQTNKKTQSKPNQNQEQEYMGKSTRHQERASGTLQQVREKYFSSSALPR